MAPDLAATSAVNVSYGPSAIVAARPILPTKRKAVAATDGERNLAIARTRAKQDAIDDDLSSFWDYAKTLSTQMSQKYGKKPDYYLRLMFSGGASMQKAREPSAYNAWSHNLAKEANEGAQRSHIWLGVTLNS